MHLEAELRQLNEEYIRASLQSDVAWFDAHLADDFACIESDGRLLNRSEFLTLAAAPAELDAYDLVSVDIRLYGLVAIVRAHGHWINKEGLAGESRYVDIYQRAGRSWRVVSAQITRPRTSQLSATSSQPRT